MFNKIRRIARALTSSHPLLRMRKSMGSGKIWAAGTHARSRVKTSMREIPGYMRRDVKRAKKMGVTTNYSGKRSIGRSYASAPKPISPFKQHIFMGGRASHGLGATRQSRLTGLRHEIGHQEAFSNPHDKRRMNKIFSQTVRKERSGMVNAAWGKRQGRKATRLNEKLAWKNAIRASKHGNIHWDTVHKALGSYYKRKSGKTDPHFKRDFSALQRYQRMIRRPGFRARFKK